MGGTEEYIICDALKSGRLFKPLVAWCIGTCANMFTSEVQFGHAGASANSEKETAVAKNKVNLMSVYMFSRHTAAYVYTDTHTHTHTHPRTHSLSHLRTHTNIFYCYIRHYEKLVHMFQTVLILWGQ